MSEIDRTPLRFEALVPRLLSGARSRAKNSNREVQCDLTETQLMELWGRIEGRCEVSGLEFSDEAFANALVKRPFAPSLDRILPGGHYTLENIRLVCVCANFSMNEWGLDTLVRLANAVTDRHRSDVIRERLVTIWRARLEGKIEEALIACERMPPDYAKAYRRRIAGLRRALTLSPEGLRAAAAKARRKVEPGQ